MVTKNCPFCKQILQIADFYSHPSTSDKLLNICKSCHKARIREARSNRIEYYREFDRARSMLPHRVEARKQYAQTKKGKDAHDRANRQWILNNKLRKAASTLLGNAIKSGKIRRCPCVICGKKAQAHHPDYDRPLDVVWLCAKHHKQAHAIS